MAEKKNNPYFEAVGRRKTAIARVRIFKGKGEVVINDKSPKDFFSFFEYQKNALLPLTVTGLEKKLDISVKVSGSGPRSQADAIRHGISRALVKMDEELKPALKAEGFMTRDPRAKERKKPGLKRARRAPQWRKR